MLDISIESSKINGRPKGRPGFGKPKGNTITFPEKSYRNIFKMHNWLASGLERELNRNKAPRASVGY